MPPRPLLQGAKRQAFKRGSSWQARPSIPVPRRRNWLASSHLQRRADAIVILSRILEHKKAELRHKQSRGYLSELKAKIQDAPGPLGFAVDPRSHENEPAVLR